MDYRGYDRVGTAPGVRNYLAILPTVGCANGVALDISNEVEGARPLLHHQGCGQLSPDLARVQRVLAGLADNPNVGAVLIVNLECGSTNPEEIKAGMASSKPVEVINILELGGAVAARSRGVQVASRLCSELDDSRRKAEASNLIVGVKCGASDATSGIASNPATGVAVDMLIEAGGTVIFGETTELLGAEHVIADRAASEEVKGELLGRVEKLEERIKAEGVDLRGSQPSAGNIEGGLTTIEEKSLGAIAKSGTKDIQGVLEYGDNPPDSGLYFMDSGAREMELLTGLGASGSHIILFSTGLGAPQGFPFCPVLKISGNGHTTEHICDHIDLDVSTIVEGTESIEQAGERIFQEVLKVASGAQVKAERIGYDNSGVNSDIYTTGPIV